MEKDASLLRVPSQNPKNPRGKAGDTSSIFSRNYGSGSGSGSARRLSRLSETVTVITKCEREPETCILCGAGIPYTKCITCDSQAHKKCIDALFCKKINTDCWKCPKCVTIDNMNKTDQEKSKESKTSQILSEEDEDEYNEYEENENIRNKKISRPSIASSYSYTSNMNPNCPFCRIDIECKNCQCIDSMERIIHKQKLEQIPLKKCLCRSSGEAQIIRYNSDNFSYKNLCNEDENKCNSCLDNDECRKEKSNIKYEDDEFEKRYTICWSIAWFLLLITFAFPIAHICAPIFIIVYCCNACCKCCHPVCCFFLEGVKLPGTCCLGIISGDPMCKTVEKEEKC